MKTTNAEPSGQHAAAATRGSRSTNLAGSKGMVWRDASTESVGQIRDMTVTGGLRFTDNDDGTGILSLDDGGVVDDPDPGTPEVQVETAQGTGMTIDVPADIENGTFMLMVIWKDDDPGITPVVVTGWTQIGDDDRFTYFWRIADGEPLDYSVTYGPGNRRAIGVIVGIPDIDTTNPIASFSYSVTSDVVVAMPQGTYYLLAGTEVDSGAVTFTDPTDWDILAQGQTGGSYPNTAHESGVLAGRLFTGTEFEGQITFGSNHGTWDAIALIALKKAGPLDAIETDISELERTRSAINVRHLITGDPPFKIIGHRGDINPVDGYPQDTLEAYRQAMIRGAAGLEFGVQRDSEGTWQCMHDTTVDATTDGTGAVSSKTTAQMAALNIDGGLGYDAGRHGTSLNVPTLAQALDAILPYDPIIMLAPKELTDEALTALATYIRDAGLQERTVILGYWTGTDAAVHGVAPNILTADPDDPDIHMPATTDVVSAAYVQGFEPASVYPYFTDALWGTDETATLTTLWTYGCRGVLTNDLPRALLWRNDVVSGTSVEGAGHYEVLMDGLGNPLDNGTGTDWLWVWVP